MSPVFSINEVVRFAIEIEKEGILFYDLMASKTKNDDSKEIFKKLSDDEKLHQAIFETLLSSLPENEKLANLENEYVAYLKAMIESSVFDKNEVAKIVESFSTDLEAIDYAIGKEKDSIVFYLNLLKLTPKETDIETIEKIIKEEQTHVLKLLDQKEKIN